MTQKQKKTIINSRILSENIMNKKYDTQLSYPSYKLIKKGGIKVRQQLENYRQDSLKLKNQFKLDCKKYSKLYLEKNISDETFEKIFHYSWENSHSGDFLEVLNYLSEILEIGKSIILND